MDTTFHPKLLDVVEFPATLLGEESAGTAQGTVVEDFGTALLVEVSNDQGVPSDFATVPVDVATTVWSAPKRGQEATALAADAKTSFEKGLLLLHQGLVQDAKREFRTAFELDPRCAGALMNMGSDVAKAGNYDFAIFLYELVLELQPDNRLTQENLAAAYINRGVAFARQGVLEKAIEDFDIALWSAAVSPDIRQRAQHNLVAAYTQLGTSFCEIKRYRESLGSLLKALEIDPSEITRRNLAIALVSLQASNAGRNSEVPSATSFRRALQMGLTLSECLNAYGATLASLGNLQAAQRSLEAAVRADPQNENPQKNLASIQTREAASGAPPLNLGIAPIELEAAAA